MLAPKGGGSMGQDQDDTVVVPITTVQRRLVRSSLAESVHMALIQVRDVSMLEGGMAEIRALMRQRHRIGRGKDDDFEIWNMTQMVESLQQSAWVMSALLGAVASIYAFIKKHGMNGVYGLLNRSYPLTSVRRNVRIKLVKIGRAHV